MKLDNVKYAASGEPYVEGVVKSGTNKDYVEKLYGKVLICPICGKPYFVRNAQLKRGQGRFCGVGCFRIIRAKLKREEEVATRTSRVIKDRVVYFRNDGKVYIEEKKRGRVTYIYGQIRRCLNCEQEFFAKENEIEQGEALFCSKSCARSGRFNPQWGKHWESSLKGISRPDLRGEKSATWKGGISRRADGYILVYVPDHPYRSKKNYVMQHRLVMEKKLGRYLKRGETVHHINGDRTANNTENLVYFETMGQHRTFHLNLSRYVFEFIDEYLPHLKEEYRRFMQDKSNLVKETENDVISNTTRTPSTPS
jgi:uncharacterized protein (DUF1330 family)